MAKEFNVELKFTTKKRGARRKANLYEDCNGGNIVMKKEKDSVLLPRNEKPFEYRMSKAQAAELLKNRRGEDKKLRPNEYLCKVVNSDYNLRGTCVYVHQD